MHLPTACSIQWMQTLHRHEGLLSDDFRRVGDSAIEHLRQSNHWRHPDSLFMPIAYLYRHSLELALKHLLRLALVLGAIESTAEANDSLGRHDLARLWKLVRVAIEVSFPSEDRAPLRNVEVMIRDFQKIDGSGQNLRYMRDKSRRPTSLHFPRSLDLLEFRTAFEGVHNLLSGCSDALTAEIDARADAEGW